MPLGCCCGSRRCWSGPLVRQLLLRARLEGVEVINLGRRPITRRGEPLEDAALLEDGDPLELDGAPLATIRAHASVPGTARWLLRVDDGPAVGMARTPFSIGGGDDDLRVEGWPPAALQLQDVGHRLIASAAARELRARLADLSDARLDALCDEVLTGSVDLETAARRALAEAWDSARGGDGSA